jgi:hypothetical protein
MGAAVPACPRPAEPSRVPVRSGLVAPDLVLLDGGAGGDACGLSTKYVDITGFIALDFISSKVET